MSNQIARFERIAERLVEGSLSRLFAGQLHPQEIVAQLARAVEDNAQDNVAPDHFWVYLHPAEREVLLEVEPGLEPLLAERVVTLARQAELDLYCDPMVELLPRPDLPRQSVVINAAITTQRAEQTRILNVSALRRETNRPPDGSTYLIIDGQRHISLTRSVYTLGRRLDCDVVLSDPRVSRRHAQLRWRFGRYVLYDLGSVGGTMVNGHPITEVVLEPGDVFSLGGGDIIYGRDSQDEVPVSDGDTTRDWARSKVSFDSP